MHQFTCSISLSTCPPARLASEFIISAIDIKKPVLPKPALESLNPNIEKQHHSQLQPLPFIHLHKKIEFQSPQYKLFIKNSPKCPKKGLKNQFLIAPHNLHQFAINLQLAQKMLKPFLGLK